MLEDLLRLFRLHDAARAVAALLPEAQASLYASLYRCTSCSLSLFALCFPFLFFSVDQFVPCTTGAGGAGRATEARACQSGICPVTPPHTPTHPLTHARTHPYTHARTHTTHTRTHTNACKRFRLCRTCVCTAYVSMCVCACAAVIFLECSCSPPTLQGANACVADLLRVAACGVRTDPGVRSI